MKAESIVGIVAGILTAASLLPQLVKIIKEKKSDDVSAGMLIVLMLGLCTWIAYGIMKNDLPIIVTNAFSVTVNLSIIILKKRYSS